MFHSLIRCLAPALIAAGLTAQAVPPAAAAPPLPAPHVRVTALGPQGWRLRLGPTNLGVLLDGEPARAVWRPLLAGFGDDVASLLGDQAEAARQRFFGYEGAIHVDLWFDDVDVDNGLRAMSIVAEGDGRTDMARLAADLHLLQEVTPAVWDEAIVAGERMRVRAANAASMCEARIVNGCLVVAVTRSATESLDALYAAAAARAGAANFDRTTAAKRPPLVVDVAPPLAFARMMGLGADDDRLRPLGLDGVQGVTLTLSSAGPRVQCEAAVRFSGAPAGLMAALMPARAALPRLARALPAAAPTFRVGHFGFGALWDAIVAFAAAETRKSPAAFTDEAKAELGVDLGAEFFRLLADEVLMTTQPVEDPERPAKATWAMAIAVQDGPAFQRGLKALVDGVKPHLTRQETTTLAGVPCNRYGNVLAYPLWLGSSARAFYLAGGSDAAGELAQLIAAVEAAPADDATPAVAAALAGLQRALPAGHSGAARYDLQHGSLVYDAIYGAVTESIFSLWLGVRRNDEDAIAAREAHDEAKDAWLERLRAHDLATLRTATGFADGTWRFRLYW
jgi:hypothetical protein